jgi:DNA repair protein RecO (recombination protein O)
MIKLPTAVGTDMRLSYTTPAVVLRCRPFGESDKIVSLLTKDFGKISGIAKGAMRSRRRFVNSLEPLALVNVRFQDRPHSGLVFILTADLTLGYRQLVKNLDSICHAAYMAEITDGLVGEREENAAVYQHLSDSLRHLDLCGASLRSLIAYELKLLRLVGYQPVLDKCRRCSKEPCNPVAQTWFFSSMDGGVLCDSCAVASRDTLPLSSKAREVLVVLQSENETLPSPSVLPLSVVSEIRAVILRFMKYHMAREIKSALFLDPQR